MTKESIFCSSEKCRRVFFGAPTPIIIEECMVSSLSGDVKNVCNTMTPLLNAFVVSDAAAPPPSPFLWLSSLQRSNLSRQFSRWQTQCDNDADILPYFGEVTIASRVASFVSWRVGGNKIPLTA